MKNFNDVTYNQEIQVVTLTFVVDPTLTPDQLRGLLFSAIMESNTEALRQLDSAVANIHTADEVKQCPTGAL